MILLVVSNEWKEFNGFLDKALPYQRKITEKSISLGELDFETTNVSGKVPLF